MCGSVVAQTPDGQLPPELLACAQETDVERRLECFDREMARLSETPVPEVAESPPPEPEPVPEPEPEPVIAEAPEPVVEPEPVVAERPEVAEAPEPPAAAEPAPESPAVPSAPEPAIPAATGAAAVTATTNESASAADDFGLADQEQEQISAVVTDIAHRPYGEFVVLLDNGQIWEQKHRDNRFRIDVGDEVTISEGLVSGYRLTAADRNNSVQVERLK